MKEIYKKIMEIQKLCLAVTKDSKNPFFKSNYVSLDNLVSTITPHLNSIWLVVYHFSQDKNVNTVVADVDSWETITSSFPMIESNDPQKLGSCISYAKRYNLAQIFNIITDRDDDANAASVPPKAVELSDLCKTLKARIDATTNRGDLTVVSADITTNKNQWLLSPEDIITLQTLYNNKYKSLSA